jgi:hypothetical protein
MRIRQFLQGSAFALLGLSAAASSQTYDGPPPAEDYGHQRLPKYVYQKMVIPSETAAVPEAPPPASPHEGDEPICHGMGCPPSELSVAQQLLASGPDTTQIYGMFESPAYQFAVVGFVKEGWPLSVEYVAQPDTVTVLRVRLYHERKILIFPLPFFEVAFKANLDGLDAEKDLDDPWHRVVTIPSITLSREADAAANADLHVARYEVRSYRLSGGQVTKQRAPLKVIGITVGPDVVGSLTLSGAQFDNGKFQIPNTDVPPTELGFRYRADRSYDLLRERIERYSDHDLAYSVTSLIGTPHTAVANQKFNSKWRLRHNLPPGYYRASVIGWWQCHGEPVLEKLDSCPNNPNWAVGNSDDVELFK